MNKKFGIKEVVAMGIGTALFVVLTEVQIPIGIPNTSLQPRMAVLAFLSHCSMEAYGGAGYSRKRLSVSRSAHLPRSSLFARAVLTRKTLCSST